MLSMWCAPVRVEMSTRYTSNAPTVAGARERHAVELMFAPRCATTFTKLSVYVFGAKELVAGAPLLDGTSSTIDGSPHLRGRAVPIVVLADGKLRDRERTAALYFEVRGLLELDERPAIERHGGSARGRRERDHVAVAVRHQASTLGSRG